MGINVFTASGRCGSDMTVRYTPAGKAIGEFSLPVETGYGENKKTSWVTCKVFGERADKLAQYVKKGSLVTVTGAFQLDEWEKDGHKHSRPVILVNDLQLPPNQQSQQGHPAQQPQGGYAAANGSQPQSSQASKQQGSYQDFDDSIPF